MGTKKLFIKVEFTEDVELERTGVVQFSDSILYSEEDYLKLSQKDIDQEIQNRVEAWKYKLSHPEPSQEPTKEQLERTLADKKEDLAELQSLMTEKGYLAEEEKLMG